MARSRGRSARVGSRIERLEFRTLLSVDLSSITSFDALRFDEDSFETDHILVRYLPELAPTIPADEALASLLVPGLRALPVAEGVGVAEAIAMQATDPGVVYAVPDYRIAVADREPNDPIYANGWLWGLENNGSSGGTVDADIDAARAWGVGTGSGDTVVAVVDSGIDTSHPDLAANLWTNPGEIPGNGIDDDGNGFTDDVHGYDFVNRDGDPTDDHGHGTHVAGTIGAVGDNGIGVVGVNWHVRLMALKVLDASGIGSFRSAVEALQYAVQMGAKVSNHSYGASGANAFYAPFRDAIVSASVGGHLMAFAAGNDGTNNDSTPFYPARYAAPSALAVAATDRNDRLAGFSNYGANTVALAAPGVSILSTTRGGGYGSKSGTSMAAPHVAGALALLADQHPTWSSDQVVARLLANVDPLPGLNGRVSTGGRLNIGKAMAAELDGPRIVSARFEGEPGDALGLIRLTFSEPIVPSTFALGDILTLSGPGGAIASRTLSPVAGSSGLEYEIGVGAVRDGDYHLVLGTDIRDSAGNFMDQDGNGLAGEIPNDQFDRIFTIASPAPASLSEGGFETPPLGSGYRAYAYRPRGSSWTFESGAGIAGNATAFTNGNPPAPEGGQVGFIQQQGVARQAVQIDAAGTYRLDLLAAQRGNFPQAGQDFAVVVDGVEVARFRPSGTAYRGFSARFELAVGPHQIALVGRNTAGGDNTVFVDQVALSLVETPAPRILSEGGFETPPLGSGYRAYAYRPRGSSWTFESGAGIAGNATAFTNGNPPAPEGGQVGFIQQQGVARQAVQIDAAGTYRLDLLAAQRGNFPQAGQDFAVVVDGVEVARFRPSGTAYRGFSARFELAVGPHQIALVGRNTAGGDNTVFVDQVALSLDAGASTSVEGVATTTGPSTALMLPAALAGLDPSAVDAALDDGERPEVVDPMALAVALPRPDRPAVPQSKDGRDWPLPIRSRTAIDRRSVGETADALPALLIS